MRKMPYDSYKIPFLVEEVHKEIGMEEVLVASQICLDRQRMRANLYGTMRENGWESTYGS